MYHFGLNAMPLLSWEIELWCSLYADENDICKHKQTTTKKEISDGAHYVHYGRNIANVLISAEPFSIKFAPGLKLQKPSLSPQQLCFHEHSWLDSSWIKNRKNLTIKISIKRLQVWVWVCVLCRVQGGHLLSWRELEAACWNREDRPKHGAGGTVVSSGLSTFQLCCLQAHSLPIHYHLKSL